MGAGLGECGARLRAVCRAGAARPHHRHADRRAKPRRAAVMVATRHAAHRLGRLRAFHHRLRHADRALRRSSRASPPPRRPRRLFRARAAASAHLSRQHPFRPADESDVAGHRRVVGTVGRVLPRPPLVVRLAARAAADLAFHQLAACLAADRAVHRIRGLDGADRAQDPHPAKPGRTPLLRPRRARLRHAGQTSRWCKAFPGSKRKSPNCARS